MSYLYQFYAISETTSKKTKKSNKLKISFIVYFWHYKFLFYNEKQWRNQKVSCDFPKFVFLDKARFETHVNNIKIWEASFFKDKLSDNTTYIKIMLCFSINFTFIKMYQLLFWLLSWCFKLLEQFIFFLLVLA